MISSEKAKENIIKNSEYVIVQPVMYYFACVIWFIFNIVCKQSESIGDFYVALPMILMFLTLAVYNLTVCLYNGILWNISCKVLREANKQKGNHEYEV